MSEKIPVKRGEYSTKKYLVTGGEFGQRKFIAIANCWFGMDNRKASWYLDKEIYHLDSPLLIVEPVTHYMPIPELSKEVE